jgi:hypothetical protein
VGIAHPGNAHSGIAPPRNRPETFRLPAGRRASGGPADERLGKVIAGMVIAAVLCAGCVGWSFISNRLTQQTSGDFGDADADRCDAVDPVIGSIEWWAWGP